MVSENSEEAAELTNGKYKLQDNWKLLQVVDIIRRHPNVMAVKEKPLAFKWLQRERDVPKHCLNAPPNPAYDAYGAYVVKCTHPTFLPGYNVRSTSESSTSLSNEKTESKQYQIEWSQGIDSKFTM
ncbi:MAG: hypothetical protein WBZ36_09025 [Candidatus Nitrosopolaris sp.]